MEHGPKSTTLHNSLGCSGYRSHLTGEYAATTYAPKSNLAAGIACPQNVVRKEQVLEGYNEIPKEKYYDFIVSRMKEIYFSEIIVY